METNDILRVVNRGADPVEVGWDSKSYTLQPGKDAFVPFPAVSNAFGDPRAGAVIAAVRDQHGTVGWVPDRASEIRRLRAKYDNQFGDERYVVNHPEVEVYSLDGERLLTVLEDQDGSSVLLADQTQSEATDQANEIADLRERQREMEARLSQLVTLEQQNPEEPTVPPQDDAVTDEAIQQQQYTQPPEDTGGDMHTTVQQERKPPPAGSPGIDWKSLEDANS